MGLEKINILRKEQKLSLDDLAKKSGVPKSTLSKLTAGITQNPNLETIQAIARALGVPVDYFDDEPMDYGHMPDNIHPIHRRLIPVLGNVAAGEPIWADEQHDDYIEEEGGIRADFALRVKGDSMAPLIQDNDFVYVRRQDDVLDGQIAVVLTDDSATLKLVYHQPGGLQLVSLNPAYPPMLYSQDNSHALRIIGLAVSYKRSLLPATKAK